MEKKLHSSRENVRYMLHNWWEWDRKSIWFCALRVPALVLLPMLTALIPKLMIDCITQNVSVPTMIGLIAVMSALVAALSWIDPFLQGKMTGVAQAAAIRYSILTFRKAMTADYENMESMEGREKFERGRGFALYGRYSDSQALYEIIVSLCANATGIVSYLAVLSALRPTMLLLIAVTCVGEFFLVRYTAKAELDTRKKNNPLWVRFDYLYKNAHNFSAGKDIRLYGAGDWFLLILAQLTATYTKVIGKYTRQVFTFSAGRALLSMLREAVAYIYLIGSVLAGTMGVSDFIFYFGIVTGFAAWILGITQQLQNLDMVATECDHFRAFLEMPDRPRLQSASALPAKGAQPCSITFENVDFSYNQQTDVLHNISFHAPEGSTTALIGPSGSGKSTVANLIARFWDVTKGCVRIGGQDIRELNPDGLLHYISEVFQENTLLSDTIYNNIKAGREDATEQEVIAAAKAAHCHEFIERLPNGYQTHLAEGGNTLSGGEKQRIAIARAILKDAPILLLDESTASLDADNEAKINQALDRLMKGKTVFVIAHRLNTIQNADQIIVLNQGRIEETGTHEELLRKKGHYYEMVQEQQKAREWIVKGA